MKSFLNVFFLLFLSNIAFAQEPNDCATALIVCGNGAFSSNAIGSGNIQEINSCGGFESNSIWLEINIVQGGTLGFNLIPDDPDINVDYDFWVYGPNPVCGSLGSPIRCATTNPFEAGLSNNLTGMNGSTLLTQTGPGSDGNGYVRWLTVTPGQTYYIAIDRPIGDGGFQIQWTGTAASGTGAFPSPPSANHIADVLTCSNTPNVGIFDLNAVRALINPDITGNTITFYNSITDANDGINALPNIYSNISNPETIYVRVTDNIAGCYTVTDFDLVVNLVPNASVSISDASICVGSPVTVTFTGTPNATINYTVDSGAIQSAVLNASGSFIITTSPTLTNTYTLTNVRIVDALGNTLCSQPLNQMVSVTVTQLPTVTISGTTTICSGTSSVITFNGTPNATVTYTVDTGPNQTIILDGLGTATLTTPLLTSDSTYNLVSVATSGTPVCSQSQTGSAVITVPIIPAPTISVITQPTCTIPTGTIVVSAPLGANLEYSVNGVTYQTSPTISGLVPNNYNVTVRNTTNGCVSTATVVTINALPTISAPTASATVQPSCTIAGTIVVSAPTGANFEYSVNGVTYQTSPTFSGLTPNNYNVTVRNTTNGCVSTATVVTINAVPTLAAPTASATVQPTCTIAGTIVVSAPTGANFEYSVNGVTYQSSPSFSGLVPNNYNVTVRNTTNGCVSTPTVVTINALPTVAAPTASATVQPTCTTPTGTIVVSAPLGANFEYSVNAVTYQASPSFSGLVPNNYNVTVRNTTNGCVSVATVVTINPLPSVAAPTASATVQPTCTAPTGTILVSAPLGANFEYSINGVTYQTSPSFSGLVPNNYNVTVQNTTNGCVSTATVVIINAVPTISAPTASATVQPTCITPTGTIVVSAPTGANLEYSVNGVTYQTSPSFSGLVPNNYNVTVRNTTNGCLSTITVVTINALPTVAAPTASATVQPTCTTPTGTIVVSAPTGANLEYSVNGVTYQTSPIFSGLVPTNYNVTVRNTANGCVSTSTVVTVNPIPNNPSVATFTIIQPACTGSVGFLTITSPLGIDYQYALDGLGYQSGVNFSNIPLGSHFINVRQISTGCISNQANFNIAQVGNDVTVNFNPPSLEYCDPNNDGFGIFDLTQVVNFITSGAPYIVSFHETIVDATINGTAIPNPTTYENININTQTIYIRVQSNTTACYEIVQLQLIVDPTPEATEPDAYELCDYTGAAGFETFDLTSTISDILGTINPLTHTVTFYTTQLAAESGTGSIINPTSYISDTQTIYVRVETTATGCYDIVPLQLIVNPLPNATQPNYPQYSLCDTTGAVGFETFDLASQVSSILLGQTGMDVTFYPSLSDAQGDTNAITNLQYTNTQIYVQTLGIRITNQDTDCYVISTMDIRVEPLPTLIPLTAPYTLCDDNQDGFSCDFDLLSLEADMLGGASGSANYILSFYETLTDAQTGNTVTDIDPTQPYCNINPFVQLLYVRAEDPITHCYSILVIELNVSPSPIAPVNLGTITVCDQDSLPQNARTVVDLTQQTAAILAQQTGAASDYTVEYYTTELLAEQGTLPIINDTSYDVSDGDTIWVRVEHKTTNCYNIGSFEIEINTPLLLTTPTPLNMCDDDAAPNNQFHVFDLTIKDNEINQGTGYAVTYYPSLQDARNATNVITTPTAYQNVPSHPGVQTLGVVVTTAAGCTSITTLDIRVLPIPTPNTTPTPLAPKCDDNNPGDMLEVFDLTVNEAYIGNGDPNLTFHYFATQANAINNVNELIPATAALVGANVWIRVENNGVDYQNNNCYVLVEQPLTVNPLPIVVQPQAPYRACDNNTDGISVFDLTNPQLATAILGATQLPADFRISYHLTQAAATAGTSPLPNSYTNVTPNAQDIYVRVVNIATGCVNTGILPLAVEAYARAAGPWDYNECDNDGNPYDGVGLIDLTSYASDILDGQDATIFLLSYYTSLADAVAGTNALTLAQAQAYQTDADIDTIWVKVENSSNLITPVCYAITTINIRVERYPNPIINTANDITTICVDYITNQVVRPLTLNSGVVNPGNYTFEWFEGTSTTPIPGATGPTYTVDTAEATGATREYTVRVTSVTPQGCQTTSNSFPVIQSGQAVVTAGTVGYTVTGAFSSTQIITVTVEGYGAPDYQYSLDDGPRQDSNVFEGVSMGTHVIHVWDAKGNIAYSCEELVINEVYIIDYPHYFTPNGDGIHDTWNVVGLDEAKIFIFDRYGKLLKQISPTGAGWDGTYNGHLLPSDDYWFTVDFAEGGVMKQFKSHFAMKR